jgi:hypothetical protein
MLDGVSSRSLIPPNTRKAKIARGPASPDTMQEMHATDSRAAPRAIRRRRICRITMRKSNGETIPVPVGCILSRCSAAKRGLVNFTENYFRFIFHLHRTAYVKLAVICYLTQIECGLKRCFNAFGRRTSNPGANIVIWSTIVPFLEPIGLVSKLRSIVDLLHARERREVFWLGGIRTGSRGRKGSLHAHWTPEYACSHIRC